MSYQEPRRQTSDVILACEETQYRTSQEFTTRAFSPTTSTNTMTTTTITDANVATAVVGAYLMPEDGNAKDQVRQVKSFSSTTATVDAAWTSTASVTSVRVWTPADVPVRATGSGSTTTVVSSPHANITNENTTDYWVAKGYHLVAAGGQNAGKASKVTGFTPASGTFTVASALTSTVAGELFLLRKRLRPEGGSLAVAVQRNKVDRSIVGFGDAAQAMPINHTGTAAFNLPVRGLTASAGNGTAAVPPVEASDLLSSIMTQTLDTGDLAASASGAVVTAVTGGTRWTVGGFALLNTGEVGQVRSVASTSITLGSTAAPHFTAAGVQAQSAMYAAAHYKRKSTDFRTFTFDYFMGGLTRKVLHGCMPTLNIAATRDQIVTLNYAYTAGEAHEYNLSTPVAPGATLPITIIDTTVPFDGKGSRVLLNGTAVLLNGLTINLGFKPTMRNSLSGSNQSDGMMMVLEHITLDADVLLDEDDKASFEDIMDLGNRSAAVDFLYQKGSAPASTFAMCIPALQLTEWPTAHQEGQGHYKLKGVAVLPQSVPGNSFDAALPAFSCGWM